MVAPVSGTKNFLNSDISFEYTSNNAKEYQHYLKNRLDEVNAKIADKKCSIAKIKNDSTISQQKRRNLSDEFDKKITELKQRKTELRMLIEDVEKDLELNTALQENGLFGRSLLGQAISGIVQVSLLPITVFLNLAERHSNIAIGAAVVASLMGFGLIPVAAAQDTQATKTKQATKYNQTMLGTTDLPTQNTVAATNQTASAVTTQANMATTDAISEHFDVKNQDATMYGEDIVDTFIKGNQYVSHEVSNIGDNCIKLQIKDECKTTSKMPSFFEITTARGDKAKLLTKNTENCNEPFVLTQEPCTTSTQKPTITFWQILSSCLYDSWSKSKNDTLTHTIGNSCNRTASATISAACYAQTNQTSQLTLNPEQQITIITPDTPECLIPIKTIKHNARQTFEQRFCPSSTNLSFEHTPKPNEPRFEKIVGGRPLSQKEANSLVYYENTKDGWYCSGTLISEKHVLTAAHCVKDFNVTSKALSIDDIYIRHDPTAANNEEQAIPTMRHKVIAGHIPECYAEGEGRLNNCDIALLELETPISNASPMPLPSEAEFCEFAQSIDKVQQTKSRGKYDKEAEIWQGGNAHARGFGKLVNEKGQLVESSIARQANVVVKSISSDGHINADPTTSGDQICKGDSGGSLVYTTADGKVVQVGINSSIDFSEKLNCNGTAHFTGLQPNSANRQWLDKKMKEDPKARIAAGDLTHLRTAPNSCVQYTNTRDGWFSQTRRLSFTNNCRGKNHPSEVNIRFYTGSARERTLKQEKVATTEVTQEALPLSVGKTKVVYNRQRLARPVYSWADQDRKREELKRKQMYKKSS